MCTCDLFARGLVALSDTECNLSEDRPIDRFQLVAFGFGGKFSFAMLIESIEKSF